MRWLMQLVAVDPEGLGGHLAPPGSLGLEVIHTASRVAEQKDEVPLRVRPTSSKVVACLPAGRFWLLTARCTAGPRHGSEVRAERHHARDGEQEPLDGGSGGDVSTDDGRRGKAKNSNVIRAINSGVGGSGWPATEGSFRDAKHYASHIPESRAGK